MKWLDNVFLREDIALLGNGIRETVITVMCPRCHAIQKPYMVLYNDNEHDNIIPKYCAYCGKKLVKETKND